MKMSELAPKFEVLAPSPIAAESPDISGLAACIEDARQTALEKDSGSPEPDSYAPLLARLESARARLSPLYQEAMASPFIATLRKTGESGFNQILLSDPGREGLAALMLDIAQSILQSGEGFARAPTNAFAEVVTDLYDGFLSAEDRQGVEPPDRGVIPPLVKWGNPEAGPYTWPVDATSAFGCKAAVVSLPPANARAGLLAWPALGHETAGHDILHADTGLEPELATALQQGLRSLGYGLDQYWSARIDETSSDVMGILNVGPAAGIGLIGYFRALNAASTGEPRLRSEGPKNDPHPADVLRGYLAAETVGLLGFSGRDAWSSLIARETNADVQSIVLAGVHVSVAVARQSAWIVAQTLVRHCANSLENHALGEIQDWRDADEQIVLMLRTALRASAELPPTRSRIYAAHVVAAAVTEAVADGSEVHAVFDRMIALLDKLHGQNPASGPLILPYRGDLCRELAFRSYPLKPGVSLAAK